MKMRSILLLTLAVSVWAQAPSAPTAPKPTAPAANPAAIPAVDPTTVVATINGKAITAADMGRILGGLSPESRAVAQRDPMQFLSQYAHFQTILGHAEKNKLDEQSPYKERLADMRRQILVNAQINDVSMKHLVTPEAQKKHYDDNQANYRESKVKLIYIPFSANNPEAKMKAKADEVVKQARAGTDFVKLVQENSEDPGSKAKNGDLGIGVRPTSTQIPEGMRKAILALKQGEVSEPYRHDNGFYIFRAESVTPLPYDQVKDEIFKELKEVGLKSWLEETRKESTFKVENEAYFSKAAGK